MGACALGNEYQTSNIAENLFISILYNFKVITDINKTDFLDEFQKIKSVQYEKKEMNLVEERETYLSVRFRDFRSKFIDDNNPFCSFHEIIFPSFDSLFDSYLKDYPEYNLLVFALPYLRESNKFKVLINFLHQIGIKPTLMELFSFIERMLHETLIGSTEKILGYINKIKNGTELLDTEFTIDNNLKKQGYESLEYFKTNTFTTSLKYRILTVLNREERKRYKREKYNKEKVVKIQENEEKIHGDNVSEEELINFIDEESELEKYHVEILNDEFKFLMNALDLRSYIWKQSKEH